MPRFMIKLSTLLLILAPFNLYASQIITPNHVYREALKLKSILYNISDKDSELIQRIKIRSAQPLHVYAVTAALNEKVAILSDLAGLPSILRPEFPDEEIQPKHVLALILAVQKNMMQLRPYEESANKKTLMKGRKPVDVLRLILACNILLDRLIIDKLTPEHPMLITQRMKNIISIAIKASGKKEPESQFEIYKGVEPRDVFANTEILFKTLTNTTHLKYHVDFPQRPYYLPFKESDIKPVHVFTVSVMNEILLKDLIRRSGYPIVVSNLTTKSKGTTPAHVNAAYEQILYLTRFFIREF